MAASPDSVVWAADADDSRSKETEDSESIAFLIIDNNSFLYFWRKKQWQ